MKTNKQMVVLLLVLAGAPLAAIRGDDKSGTPTPAPAIPAPTADKPADQDAAKAGDTLKETSDESAKRSAALAEKYGVTPQQVMDMRQKSNMGWGEIENALQIAQHIVKTSTTPILFDDALKQVLDLRAQGMGWGQIADKFGTKLGHLKHEGAGDARKDAPGRDPVKPDKPDHPVKPDRPDKPDKPENPGRGNQ